MDILVLREESEVNDPANASFDPSVIGSDYVETHKNVAVPYLVVLIIATISGTVGNILVIGAVITNRVREIFYLDLT